jgi:TRAP-type C4-dicarboxylate transport system substrate-binding protein
MGAEWQSATDDRIRLRIYAGGVAGDDPDLIRKMRIGQLHAATVTVTGLTEIDPAFALFEIPMFFDSYSELFRVLEALEPELRHRLAAEGFRLLHWGHGGWVYFFTARPATTLDEFRKLGVFVWAGNDEMTSLWRDRGFRPVPLAATDILTGLKTGMFDALPSTPIAALSLQWFRSAPHMLDLGITPLLGATIITEKAWQRIEEADRAVLEAAADRAGEVFTTEIPEQDEKAIQEMQARGLSVIPIVGTAAEGAWRAEAERFAERMREAFVPPEIYDRAVAVRDEYRGGK